MDFFVGFVYPIIMLPFLVGSFGYRSPQSIILTSEMCLDYIFPGFKLSSVYPGAPPNWNESQLKRVCRNWRSLVPCLNSIERASVSRKLLMTAVAASKPLEYLCGDGLHSYLNTYKCMNEEKTKNGIQRCAGKGIKSINQFPVSPEVKFGVCRHLNESTDCVAKYAATCGQEAAVFAKAFLEMNFETTRTKLECSGYSQTSTSSSYSVTTTTEKNFCSEQYTKDKLKKCLKLLHPTLKLTQIINDTKAVWTANQMTTICQNLERFMRCADRIFENCDIPRMKTISKVVESVFGYVCRVGLETYVRVQSCLEGEKSTKNSLQHCVKHALDINPKDFYYNGKYDEKKLCKQMAEMTGYTERAVNVCGQQAGELLKELVGNTISPYRTDVKCSSYHTGVISEDVNINELTTKCLKKIISDGNVEDIASSFVPNWPIRKFKQVCGNINTFDICINAIPKNPEERSLEIMKRILQKKIDFLCGDGSAFYTHHKQCLAKKDVQKQVATCSQDFSQKYKGNTELKSSCAVITKFRDCVRKSAKVCGAEAQILTAKYMDFDVEHFTGLPDCSNYKNGAPTNHLNILNLMLPAVTLWMKVL